MTPYCYTAIVVVLVLGLLRMLSEDWARRRYECPHCGRRAGEDE